MAKLLKTLLRQTLHRKKSNLMSLDDPYPVMAKLFGKHEVRHIIDAGASNGHVSERLLKQFPNATSYLFEPNPAYADVLAQKARENPRIVPHPFALSSTEGEMTLHIAQKAGRSSLLKATDTSYDNQGQHWQVKEEVSVPVVRIDDWKKRANVGKIDLMKLDIQAGELDALKGSEQTLRNEVSIVFTEAFFNPRYEGGALLGDLDAYLRQQGFCLYNMFSPRADANGKLLWANVLFIHEERLNQMI